MIGWSHLVLNRVDEAIDLFIKGCTAHPRIWTFYYGLAGALALKGDLDGAKAALDAWLAVRGAEPGPLFWPAAGRGRALVNGRMSDQAILLVLRKRAKEAKVAPFTPHDLRRTFIGDLLDAGADMAVVQRLAGHASVQTTARYDRRGEETKRRAAELLHVPYVQHV